jgi:hypothetical protein
MTKVLRFTLRLLLVILQCFVGLLLLLLLDRLGQFE